MTPSYRDRLRVEGLALAACGALGSVALVVLVPESREMPLSTAGQLAVLAILLEALGTRSLRRWLERAEEVAPGAEGSGDPTALWLMPPIVAGLAALFAVPGLWDAALRVTGGCLLVGLWQALRLERVVAADEERRGRTYFRAPGSRILRGTLLRFTARSAGEGGEGAAGGGGRASARAASR